MDAAIQEPPFGNKCGLLGILGVLECFKIIGIIFKFRWGRPAAFIITAKSVRELRPQVTPRGRHLYQPQVWNQQPLDSETSA